MVKIKISLSQDSVSKTIAKLEECRNRLNNVGDDIALELANKTLEHAENNYNNLIFLTTHQEPDFTREETSKGYAVVATGDGVLFDEYGTGLGAIKPHIGTSPEFISSGYHHWYMPKDVANAYNGGEQYTEGHGPGNFMYNADVWLRDNYKEIAKEKVDEVLSKL